MSIQSLLQKLQPIYIEDQKDWDAAHRQLFNKKHVIWQASSGLDFTPMLELQGRRLHGMHQAPDVLRQSHGHSNLFVFSDYSAQCLKSMKDLYDQLDDIDPNGIGFRAFHPCGYSFFELLTGRSSASIECTEIIPLQLFSNCPSLRQEYPNFHSSVTSSAIPDDLWHAVYLNIELRFKGQTTHQNLLFFHLENLLCFEQVFVAHQIPIDILYAKRVGGKSGSSYSALTTSIDNLVFFNTTLTSTQRAEVIALEHYNSNHTLSVTPLMWLNMGEEYLLNGSDHTLFEPLNMSPTTGNPCSTTIMNGDSSNIESY